MGFLIVKQPHPSERYAIFSTYEDRFIELNRTVAQVTSFFVDGAIDEAKRNVARAIKTADDTNSAVMSGTVKPHIAHVTFDGCLETIRFRHGNDAVFNVVKEIER